MSWPTTSAPEKLPARPTTLSPRNDVGRRYNGDMAWEHLKERLEKPFDIKLSLPAGTIWLPGVHFTITEWLGSAAETDEELREINVSGLCFLENRWPVENLLKLEWENPPATRSFWAMYMGDRAYVLLYDGVDYRPAAAIEPRTKPELFHTAIRMLLQDVAARPPVIIRQYRPELLPTMTF